MTRPSGPQITPRRPARGPVLLVVLLSLAVGILGGAVAKAPCIADDWATSSFAGRHYCYSDAPFLYTRRGLAVSAQPWDTQGGTVRALEYPVLTVYVASLEAKLTHLIAGTTPEQVKARTGRAAKTIEKWPDVRREMGIMFLVNLVLMSLCMAAVVLLLALEWSVRAAALTALSLPLLITTSMNWDALAVLAMIAGLVAWRRRAPVLTGVLIGLGTAAKLFPVLLGAVVLVDCVRERRWRALAWVAGLGGVVLVALNVQPYLRHHAAWNEFLRLNEERQADLGSLWILGRLFTGRMDALSLELVTNLSLLTFVVGALICMGLAFKGVLRSEALLLALVLVFLLAGKVYSPQYALWLLPLLAILYPRRRVFAGWQMVELVFFVSTFAWINHETWMPNLLYAAIIVVRVLAEICAALASRTGPESLPQPPSQPRPSARAPA